MFEEGKRCSKCDIWRALSAFYPAKGTRDGLRGDCKACFKRRAAERYRKNPEPAKERARQWAADNPERVKARAERDKASGRKAERDRQSYIRRTHGLTEAEYERMMAVQQGRYAICGVSPSGKARLHLDHDHETGAIRGFLCFRCNNALGDFSDSQGLLREAIAYLDAADPEAQRLRALVRLRLQRELLGQ